MGSTCCFRNVEVRSEESFAKTETSRVDSPQLKHCKGVETLYKTTVKSKDSKKHGPIFIKLIQRKLKNQL